MMTLDELKASLWGAAVLLRAVRRIGVKSEAIESREFSFWSGESFEDFLQFASMDAEEVVVECRGYNRTYPGAVKVTELTLEETSGPLFADLRRVGHSAARPRNRVLDGKPGNITSLRDGMRTKDVHRRLLRKRANLGQT